MPENGLGAPADQARVVLVTRSGCHLCEQAADTIAQSVAAGSVGADQVSTLDVDADDDLRRRYTDHVPVVFVDGRLFAYWVLEPGRFEHALAGGDWASPPPL
ncbi:glutaredoxin family protein [Aestuariimicrobium ganziense]|uniref:glutaredoxin family protein n=1 Tax=Aestuariimicrobium ganziense TaxID=2773677 RepID=UPI001941F609|nr:glutaredoxin family protein [Aestuariimicrobium ganziense]